MIFASLMIMKEHMTVIGVMLAGFTAARCMAIPQLFLSTDTTIIVILDSESNLGSDMNCSVGKPEAL